MDASHARRSRPIAGARRFYGSWFALIAFAAIFPGFVIYHVLVATGSIPPVLRGYSTGIAALLLPGLAIAYVLQVRRESRLAPVDAVFFSFVAYFAFVVVLHLAVGANETIAFTQLAVVVQFIALFLTFRLISVQHAYVVSWLSFVTMTSIIFANISAGAFVISALGLAPASEHAASHQDYAFVYTVTALFCVVSLRSAWLRGLLYLVAIPALFFTGARSEFAGFLLAAMIIETCLVRRRIVMIVIAAGLLAAGLTIVNSFMDSLPANRVVDLIEFGFVSENTIRQQLFAAALRMLADHPLLGSFASYMPGEYAHNIVSAWVDLGALGFATFTALLLLPAVDLVLQAGKRARDPEYLLVLVAFAMSILLAIVAKNFTYALFPVAFGLYARDSLLRARMANPRVAFHGRDDRQVASPPGKLEPTT